MLNLNDPEIKFALHAVRQAGLLVRQVQDEMVSPALTKEDRSPVTVADFAAQALVARLLATTFPDDPLVGEEDSTALRAADGRAALESVTAFVGQYLAPAGPEEVCDWIDHARVDTAGRFWTLDPIDGTKGFLRGDQYAVALALVVDGQVQVGALACPGLSDGCRPDLDGPGSIVIAARGQGTWTTDFSRREELTQLHVSTRSDPSIARVLRSFESGHTNVDQIDHFAQAMGITTAPVRMDSQAKYAVLAAGKGELMLRLLAPDKPNYREKIWDQAAGSIVLEEAGGRLTDLDGKPLDFTTGRALRSNRGILASNCLLHPAALQALAAVGA